MNHEVNLKFNHLDWVFGGLIIFDLLSFVASLNQSWNNIFFCLIIIVFAVLAWHKLSWGLNLILTELIIGSKGYLLALNIGQINISLRIGIFITIFFIWLIKYRDFSFFKKANKFLYPYLGLILLMIIGASRGWTNSFFFSDINAWLFLAILPIYCQEFNTQAKFNQLIQNLILSSCYLSIKTLYSLGLFAYLGRVEIDVFYKWLRNSGVGEITYVAGHYYRIFFQSQIFVLITFFYSLWLKLKFQLNPRQTKVINWSLFLTSTVLLAGLSRSFWLGGLVAGLALSYHLIRQSLSFKTALKLIGKGLGFLVIEIILILVLSQTFSTKILGVRLDESLSEPAVTTRVAELKPLWQGIKLAPIFGSGFGKTLTFISDDPRIRAKFPDGNYVTYAFEWGYLDIILKVGIIGLALYGWYLWTQLKFLEFFKNEYFGLFFGLIAIMFTHLTSPYLNHPLGFGFLAIVLTYCYNHSLKLWKPQL